jgi:hypothetical protein
MAKALVSEEILKEQFGPHLITNRPVAGMTNPFIPRRSWSKHIAVFADSNAGSN